MRARFAASTLAIAVAPLAFAAARTLSFEEAFPTQAEPAAVHFTVDYAAGDANHTLELWRDGERRVRRSTDGGRIDTFVFRQPGSDEFRMSILDRERRIHTRVDRASLYRVGRFVDWFDLAHGLRQPVTGYAVTPIPVPAGAPAPLAPCSWYLLHEPARESRVCWSAAEGLPLLIVDGTGKARWRVKALEYDALPPHVFEIHDEGYVRNDAGRDIEAD